ncbi:arrestin domain-containing protein 17 [Drosophila grimshawi]|uniref:GH18318 n=1 Tax=Drosophila grimshawi TaxID=7222 RepID=B4JF67_DROGR|nr:arrestin domain-containing protein 17 [Drosophila grimshawi]EDV93348.1 GH18318 [Drosophila grimshawi]
MSNNCIISFDQNEHGTYFTGQVVTGKVVVNLNKTKKLRGIKLQIFGFACAQWRRKYGRKLPTNQVRPGRRRYFMGREDYIASTTYLIGSEQSQPLPIDAGTYTYTFACPIPSHCPSSFEGAYGHIRYLAKVTFIRPGASNRTTNVGFTVLKLLDLNHENKMLREPANNEAMEYFCFMHTKAVHMKVTLQQQGYVPGQFMLIHADVRNDSSSDCRKLMIMLYLRATYTADTPRLCTISEKILLAKRESGPVLHNAQKSYTESLRIPATAPTCEHLSKVVRVSYEMRIVAVMNWLMANPKVVIPITIGNVPLATVSTVATSGIATVPRDLPCTSARAMALASGVNNPGYEMNEDLQDYELPEDGDDEFDTEDDLVPELPPPTYEQAIFMSADIADTDTNTVSEASRFTPRYPVFDVDTFQSPPPNPPPKKRRHRRRRTEQRQEKQQEKNEELDREPVESPVEI